MSSIKNKEFDMFQLYLIDTIKRDLIALSTIVDDKTFDKIINQSISAAKCPEKLPF